MIYKVRVQRIETREREFTVTASIIREAVEKATAAAADFNYADAAFVDAAYRSVGVPEPILETTP